MKKERSQVQTGKKRIGIKGIWQAYELQIAAFLIVAEALVYFNLSGSGIFFYQETNSLFIFSRDYFHSFTDRPGGLLIYAGNFLTQFCNSAFAGSLVITFLLFLAILAFRKISLIFNTPPPFSLLSVVLPVTLILLIQTRLDVHPYHLSGILIALAWFIISASLPKTLYQFIHLLLFPFVYYLTGSFSIVYAGLYISYNLLFRKDLLRFLLPASLLTVVVITFYAGRNLVFYQPDAMLLSYPLFTNETSLTTTCLTLYAGFIMLLPLLSKLAQNAAKPALPVRLGPVLALIIIIPVTVLILSLNSGREIDSLARFEKMACSQDWDGIIRLQEELQSDGIVEQYYYNLALAETGQLCSRMFFAKQGYGSMSLTLTRDNEQAFRAMYFYYAIGLTEEAHHLAYELMVQHGYRPESLKMLVRTELINGNFKVAERYINVLKKTLHYRKWAEKYEKMLFRPGLVNSDRDLGEKIKLLPGKDFFVVTDDFGNLERLLSSNPGNRIALEYKMARMMLEKDLMEIGTLVKTLRKSGYEHIPRHLEEAVVSLVNVTGEFPDLGGLLISKDTDQRFLSYFKSLKSFKGNRLLLEKGMSRAERNTFWYYLQFGLVKSNILKSAPVDYSIY